MLSPFNPLKSTLSSASNVERIAFFSDRNGNNEIYVMDTAGANLVNLTNDLGFDGSPAWSSDGTNLAFQSDRTGNMQIYVLSLADSSVSNLTNQTTFEHMEPAWSPDNTHIAFSSNRDGNYDIYTMKAHDGSGVVNLTNQTTGDNHNPTWSPDGSKIAFETTRNGKSEIYVMNVDGSAQQNLTNHSENDWHPAWSPDDSHIVFISDRDGKYEIYVMNANDGSEQTNLSNRPDSYEWKPSYSPDGTKIIFSTDRDRNADGSKNDEIYVMNANDGSAQTNLSNHSASDQFAVWTTSQSSIPPTAVPPTAVPPTAVPPTLTSIPESPDFATLELRDAWDMSEFSDISAYLNASGQRNLLTNLQVQDGIFSATSTEPNTSLFTLLMPGYSPATVNLDKDGTLNPISSANYQCLYFAMKVESGPVQEGNPDQFQVYWYADSQLGGGPNGLAYGLIHPEPEFTRAGTQPANNWKLYRVNLANPEYGQVSGFTPWNGQNAWQGLMIRPTNQGRTPFAVEWARLTSCNPNTHTLNWIPDANMNAIWLQPENSNRAIRVAPVTDKYPVQGINGRSGSYVLDTQGLPPGSYRVGLGTLTIPPTSWDQIPPLRINQTPIVTVTRPSFTSGEDYATQAGNPWDFSDTQDTSLITSGQGPDLLRSAYKDGMLEITSPSGPLPAGIDAKVYMNTPQPANASEYRYLTIRLHTEWYTRNGVFIPWANGPHGMVMRWIWTIPSLTGQPGYECHLVSEDIPFDIGWRTYTVDLYDPLGGTVEEMSPAGTPHCPATRPSWQTTPGLVKQFRFDPNENISEVADTITGGGPFHQTIDWIKLTKVDQVARGTPFPIQITLNKPSAQMQSIEYYYTTDRSQPTQNRATGVAGLKQAPFNVYLPLVSRGDSSSPPRTDAKEITFSWDTSSVAPGEYYICVAANDGVNAATYCSEAPVQVQ
jgi:Tol biopolymer transport system component